MDDLSNILLDYSDDELHSMAEEYAKGKKNFTREEELEWASILLLTGTLDEMCTKCSFQAIDGCEVEIDENCPHGYYSPMLILGLV